MIIDIAFILTMIIAIFKGLSKGFIIGIFSLLAFIIGLAAAIKLSAIVAAYLGKNVSICYKMVTCYFISFGFYCGNFTGRFRSKAHKKND